MDEQTRQTLIECAKTIEAAAAKIRQATINPSSTTDKAATKEAVFAALNFEKRTSTRIGEYEIAAKTYNSEPTWNPALSILSQNKATINNRYHEEGDTHSYWLYGEDQNRIYRQKRKPQT